MKGFNYEDLKPTEAAQRKGRIRDSCALDSSIFNAAEEKAASTIK